MLNQEPVSQTLFVGRRAELNVFDDLWASQQAEMVILYRRRRVGKTRLLTHWMKNREPQAIFWVAEPTSTHDQLRSFSQTVYNFENPTSPTPGSVQLRFLAPGLRAAGPAATGGAPGRSHR